MDEPPTSETTRLCEECGYIVEGLPEPICPECAAAIPASRDAFRQGSAWQQGQSLGAWLFTSLRTLLHPFRTFASVKIERRAAGKLMLINHGIAAMILIVAFAVYPGFHGSPSFLRLAVGVPVFVGAALFILGVLTVIEQFGIRFFGGRRNWRITRAIAEVITAHAAIGWVVGSFLMLSSAIVIRIGPLTDLWWGVDPVALLAIAFFVGMMLFECLVYVGVRRCRFANTPDSVSTPPLGPDE